jgi:hypothetical protein
MDPGTVRTVDQMRFDAARTTALGCHVSMGDHRHPDGTLDPEVYRRVGAVYRELEAVEPWIEGMRPLREAALLTEIERGAPHLMPTLPALTLHAARLLEEAGLQFDLYSVDDELPEVPLVVWPGERPATPELLKRLEQHVKRGGALLATEAALEPAADGSVSADRLARLFGVRAMSPISPPGGGSPGALSAHGHVTAGSDAAGLAGQFLLPRRGLVERPFAQVMTGPVRLLRALPGTQVLADRLPAVSTAPPCPGRRRVGAVVVQRRRVIYSAAPLFREAMESGAPDPAGLIAALCRRLLPRRLVRHTGGPTVAAHLHRGVGGYALHLVHWAMDRWDAKKNPPTAFPLLAPVQVEIAVRERVRGVRLRPGGRRLAFRQRGGTCRFTVPAWRVWQVVSVRTC